MQRTRRAALAAIAGMIPIAGCGGSGDAWAVDEQPTVESNAETRTEREPVEPTSTGPTFEDIAGEYDADIYVLAQGEQFRAVDASETEVARSDGLGRVITDAQAAIPEGRLLVATDGSLRVTIEQATGVSLGGLDGRTALTPTEDVGGAASLYRAAGETTGGQLDSFRIDMQYRGGSAVRVDGATGLVLDDVRIANVGEHGARLSDASSVDIRNSRIERTSKDAVSMTNCSDVRIDGCETTDSNRAVYAVSSSNVTIADVTARETEYNAFAMRDYTTNWTVRGCTAVDSASTPFSASVALEGSFVDCEAEGTTDDGEAGFEIEYKADNDEENQQNPVVGCSVESCTARDCNVGFSAREDDAKYDTDTPIVRPRFLDCTAVRCDTGLVIGDTVEEAVIRNFDPVECTTDIVDNGIRTIVDGVSENDGDPSAIEGEWAAHAEAAAELDVVVENTQDGTRYTATDRGVWVEQ